MELVEHPEQFLLALHLRQSQVVNLLGVSLVVSLVVTVLMDSLYSNSYYMIVLVTHLSLKSRSEKNQ